ncbi:MAG: hypothetical protein EHM72_19260 [Calditrichaeota bacterium]|nr:MAG: hypothetical protein EHM72_19260 [Calditrichota bacterium]
MFKVNTKSDYEREVELPSLIDMVFLLLIFFVTTMSVSSGGDPKSTSPERQNVIDLPKATGKSIEFEKGKLSTLLFQIEPKDAEDPASAKIVYILWGERNGNVSEDALLLKLQEERTKESPDSTFYATFPRHFMRMTHEMQDTCRAFRLIADNINRYQAEYFTIAEAANSVEIRAVKNVEFRIINHIMQECSKYEDRIPRVTFRVMAPGDNTEEPSSGI